MKEHLAFLRRYKEILRLKLNAAEDLLVNGQREPSERGVCRHLIGKVDRAVIDAAIGREPLRSDAAARVRMLAGAIRLTADLGVLLAYLEALTHVRSRAEAAQAFTEVVDRIDFASLSGTRLARLLQVLIDTFTDHERVQVLFSLLASPAFRRAFDASANEFPVAVADAFAPLRAVHRTFLERGEPGPPTVLARGVEQILCAPDPVLRGYAEPLRAGMLELALRPDIPRAVGDRAAGVLLSSLPRASQTYARLAIRRAAQLLERHADDRARVVLEELRQAQPGAHAANRWLAAFASRRLGRVALVGGLPERGRLAAGFWLDGQQSVWIRTATAPDAARIAEEARLQATVAVPGVATVVEHGIASGIPYVAVSAPGTPFAIANDLDLPLALAIAATAARTLRGLALAGIAVADAAPERFLYAAPAGIVIADFDRAGVGPPGVAEAAAAEHAVTLARRLVPAGAEAKLPPEIGAALRSALDKPAGLVPLISVLERAALYAGSSRRREREQR